MSRSLTPTEVSKVGEDYGEAARFSPGYGLEYFAEKLPDGHVRHHERQLDPQGEVLYDQSEGIDFTVGSGTGECRYLLNRAGHLFTSPISWYGHERKWGLSPGYVPPDHARFEGRATDACMSCHAGLTNQADDARDVFEQNPFRECAIGCERCHGPAGGHVKFRRKDSSVTADPLVKLESLEGRRRDAVCFQCHLQGEERIARSDSSEFDFRPGMSVTDVWLTFLRPEGDQGDISSVSHAEQMLSSRCYAGSNGQLSCLSCHDPHQTPTAEEKVAFYRARCAACHEGAAGKTCEVAPDERKKTTAEDSCIVCHMPQLGAPGIAHNVQTDHRVVRRPGAASSERQPATPTDPREKYGRLFVDGNPDVSAAEIERAWSIFLGDVAFERQDSEAATLSVQTAEKLTDRDLGDRVLATSLGKAYEVLKDQESARNVWRDALEVWDRDEYLLERLALSFQKVNQEEKAGPYFMRFLEENPFRASFLEMKAHGQARFASTKEAVDTAQQALKLDPSLVGINLWLGEVYAVMGQNELAAEHRRQAFKVKAAREALAPASANPDPSPADQPSSPNR